MSFTYVVGAYQAKLAALADEGGAEVALMSPATWKFQAWRRPLRLESRYAALKLFPAAVRLFNGRGGAFLYPISTVRQVLREYKPDIIYVEQEVFSLATFEVAVFARAFRLPLVVFCWENTDRLISRIRKWTRRFVLRTARLITPGNHGAAALLRQWGYTGPLEVLPQVGVDRASFPPTQVESPRMPYSIGFLGRLVPEKGVDVLLDAAKLLLQEGKDIRLVICGGGACEADLHDRAEELGLSGIVQWLGEVSFDDVPRAIGKMDVLVLPSRTLPGKWREQFGHVLIEAMSMGIPVVGSSCGAIPDVIDRNDLIFPEDDHRALAYILERLRTDVEFRREAIQYGMHRVDSEFTNSVLARRLVTLFRSVIAADQGRV